MDRILGRTDDMLVVRGVNVFPQLIERTLLEIEDVEPHYQIVLDRPKNLLDTLEIRVEASPRLFDPVDTAQLDTLQARVQQALNEVLGVSVTVTLMAPRGVQRSEGKARRVIDRRELN
jgi:phenylacetate-CoA ligase